MKTYWFTIACNPKFETLSQGLLNTADHHGIKIHRITHSIVNSEDKANPFHRESRRNILKLKIDSILSAPTGYDRIVYVDADTLIVNPNGFERLCGSLKEPWPTGRSPVPKKASWSQKQLFQRRLWALLKKENLTSFCPGGIDFRQEWNSGVIAGDRQFMEDLATEWARWWDLLLEVCDGYFERDQLSYKFAYTQVARIRYGFETIPKEYNCIVKRMGFLPAAHLLHRAGLSKSEWGWKERKKKRQWAIAKQKILDNRYQSWAQKL